MVKIITVNGDHNLVTPSNPETQSSSSAVTVEENSATATLEFGSESATGAFIPYDDGVFSTGKTINHGIGAQLMVRVTGIIGGSVTIRVLSLS